MYDGVGRLITDSVDGVLSHGFTYDSNGNRLTYTVNGGGVTNYVYDDQDRLTSSSGMGGNVTYSYTSNGELTRKVAGSDTTRYTYDVLGNLIKVILPSHDSIEYLIDGQNRRVGRKFNGAVTNRWLYQNQLNPVAELDSAGNVVSRFVYGSRLNVPDYMLKGGSVYRLVTDHLGSVRLVVDTATGTVAQWANYDEWGVVTAESGAGFQPFGFAGGLFDHGTRLVRFGARDYDHKIARWTATDPIGFSAGSSGLYTYVFNDPINSLDADGEFAWILAGGIIGAAVNVGVTYIANGGQLTGSQVAAAMASGFISGALGAAAGPLGGTIARGLGASSNGILAAFGSGILSGGAGAAGQAAANAIDPCNASSLANAALWGGIGGALAKGLFPSKNLNTWAQARYFGASTLGGLFGSSNAWINNGSFATSAGAGGAANFPWLNPF